jgi:hypothetical protein
VPALDEKVVFRTKMPVEFELVHQLRIISKQQQGDQFSLPFGERVRRQSGGKRNERDPL